MAKRIFRIEFGNNGAELVIGKVDEKFVEYWRNKSPEEELKEYWESYDSQ